MKEVVSELNQIVDAFVLKFNNISEDEFSAKPLPNKWSKKEVLGHLIDSALNNHRRFVCGQYESVPPKILYDQDFWVKANDYQHSKKEEVILMWKLMNKKICDTLSAMPEQNYSRLCNTGRETEQLHSIEWLAIDYVKHLKHHLNQIIASSFAITYP
jgi:DinB superfamily